MAMLNNQMVYQLQFESIPIDPIVLMVKNHKEPEKKKTYVWSPTELWKKKTFNLDRRRLRPIFP